MPKPCLKYKMLFNPTDYTTVFLSYDEPNCEDNYRHLLSLNPQALRVHGVKGSDTAHKEVAKLSKTDNVIIVDGDNFVKHNFFTTTLELPNDVNLNTSVLSFSAYNTINGNSYGNGGIKVWPVKLIEDMQTHENGTGVDFDIASYIELDDVASEIHFASDFQAFRAGFREGIKLLLENNNPKTLDTIDHRNYDRLWMWSHVGSDTKHGNYAIYGTRLAMNWLLTKHYDYHQIMDFDMFDDIFTGKIEGANDLVKNFNDPFFGDVLDDNTSKAIRESYIAPKRVSEEIDSSKAAWAMAFRGITKINDINEINKRCTMGRDKLYGNYLISGARAGKQFKELYGNSHSMLSNIFNYNWLSTEYDRLHSNPV